MTPRSTLDLAPDHDQPLAERAYALLERMVVTLELPPGQTFSENELIDRAGLGRTPVREALQRLAWEGLLDIRPRAGIAIAPVHPADWRRIIDVRTGPEMILVRAAALNASHSHEPFREAALAMQKAVIADSVLLFLRADKAFDVALSNAADNPFASRCCAPLQTLSRRFWFRYMAETGLGEAAEAHIQLIEAITTGDLDHAEAAGRAMLATLMHHAVRIAQTR
jgi:DNA-binding GntR family transcriptional regulator